MTLCSICGKEKAVIKIPYEGKYLCKKCFKKYFVEKAEKTLKKANVFSNSSGKLFVVATSGGKDSLNALYIMKMLSEKYGFDVEALLINEGISGYREFTIKALIKVANKLNVPYRIVDVKKHFGFTIDEAAKLFFEGKIEWKPCTVCGVVRRYLLNKVSREMGASYLVTGHNLDDDLQTAVMNLIRGDFQALIRGGVVVKAEHPKLVPRVRPLHYIYEKESLIHSIITGLETPYVECSYAPYSLRWNIRELLNKLEAVEPGFKYRLMVKIDDLRERFSKYKVQRFTECRLCGEPSAKEICKACEIRLRIMKVLENA